MIWLGLLFLALVPMAKGTNEIEVYFVVDQTVQSLYRGWGLGQRDIREEADYIITEMNKYYETTRLGLKIVKKDITFLTRDFTGSDMAETVLNEFYKWLDRERKYQRYNYDIAMFWTGKNLRAVDKYGRIGDAVAGLATLGKVCDKGAGIAEFRGGYGAASTTAHEIAHLLGVNHDPSGEYIMAPVTGPKAANRWSFSSKSRREMQQKLSGVQCQRSSSGSTTPRQSLPAGLNTPEKICKRNNAAAWLCGQTNKGGDDVCKTVFCQNPTSGDQCPGEMAFDGMICGKQKTCKKGRCVHDSSANNRDATDDCPYGDQKILKINGKSGSCKKQLDTYGMLNCPNFSPMCCKTCENYGGNGGNSGGHGGNNGGNGGNSGGHGGHNGGNGGNGGHNGGNGGNGGGSGGNGGCSDAGPRMTITVTDGRGQSVSGSCSQLITRANKDRCYTLGDMCCASCERFKDASNPGCFGDQSPDCAKYTPQQICPSYKSMCCETCRNFNGKKDTLIKESIPNIDIPVAKVTKREMPSRVVEDTLIKESIPNIDITVAKVTKREMPSRVVEREINQEDRVVQ